MGISTASSGLQHTIKIQGRFDFAVQNEFRKAYEMAASNSSFILDFSTAGYMDSSALGMLLLLRDYAGGDNAKVVLQNCGPEIKNILEISNFEKLFTIN
jgi:anti-anti-sigma factor